MANDERPLINEPSGLSSMALLPANLADQPSGELSNVPALVQPAAPAMPDFTVYLHALRRNWLMALGIGLLCAAVAGPAVWWGVGVSYTASSYLRVAMQEEKIAFANDNAGLALASFDLYKATQQQLVLSRLPLIAALRKPDVAKLAVIRRETDHGDPVTWLQQRVSVNYPGHAELMEVSLAREDPKEAEILVKAVVDAYLTEVVNAERILRRERLSELDRACGEKEMDIRDKRESLKKLAEKLGTSEVETLNMKQKIAIEELSMFRQNLAKVQFEVQNWKAQAAAQKALLANIDAVEGVDAEVDVMVQNDYVARQLSVEIGWKKIDQRYMDHAIVKGAKGHYADRYKQELDGMQQEFNERKAELAEMVKQKKKSFLEGELRKFLTVAAVMEEQQKEIQKDVERQKLEAEKFGNSTVDIEMMKADIKNSEIVLTGISSERDKLRVEARSPSRIVLLQKAEKPVEASNFTMRLVLTIMAMLAGMCCPAGLVALWDARAKRINNCADVSQGLRLSVIGSVPLIPSRVIRQLGSPSKRNQTWHVRLTESVDGIAARVLRKAEMEQCRVIMVSSAVGGEGKTTLATQLALSLARAGRRTVLVDFDLRRPAFDEVFGLPLEPGVCEALRQENDVSAIVHPIDTDNLSVVTAGRWDRNALASLSNGAAAAMFKELREDYDFVVVDTSPILPVADARFVSQHVDSVVLSVFRDISQAPKIQATCEILSAFGVQTIEVVVTGPNENMYGERSGYESTISA